MPSVLGCAAGLRRCTPSGQALQLQRFGTVSLTRRTALAAGPASMTVTPCTELLVRPYQASDYEAICDICQNVYGGSDYIPRSIAGFAEDPEVLLLVAQTEDDNQRVDGLVCADKRQDCLFLFGLRVRESARGNGIGRLLVDAVSKHESHGHMGSISSLVAAVAPEAVASVRIFQRLAYDHQATVDMWPAGTALAEYESLIGFPDQRAVPGSHPCIVDHIPGAQACIEAGTAAVSCSLASWRRCNSLQRLDEAVASIRQQQWDAAGKRPASGLPPWLPWVYEPWPIQCSWTQERIAAGEVWLLPTAPCAEEASSASHAASYAALMVMTPSVMFRRTVAGIMTSNDAYVAPAVQLAATKALHFVCFIDRGCMEQGAAAQEHGPDLYLTTPGRRQYYLLTKPAA